MFFIFRIFNWQERTLGVVQSQLIGFSSSVRKISQLHFQEGLIKKTFMKSCILSQIFVSVQKPQ